ncbi:MAG: hypothetical protein KC619_15640, partial [Myxococcales bacterium]|nr:hypothetical protein [Myxococcales bacterium]
ETTAGVETARETTAGVETAGESTTAEETEARLREQAGRLAMQRGELEEARADFARAFALAPTPARGWALADAQGALLETTNQAATLRALIDLDPSHERAPEARARLVVLDASLASAEVETAEVDTTAAPTTDAAPAPAEIATPTETAGEEERDVCDEPWFWAIVAVAAVGLVVTASVLTGDPGVQDPIPGTAGEVDGVVYTLVAW